MNPPVPRRVEPGTTAVGLAPGRVAEVHAQTRRGLLIAAGFVVVAVGVGVGAVRVGAGWWLPLHLFVVGGLLSAISATTQMLAVTWSAAPAARRAVVRTQRWALAAATVALVIGRETDQSWMFVAGGVAVVVAMLGLASMLLRVRRQAVTDRFAPAIEAYVAAVVAGSVGMSLGVLLGSGRIGDRAVQLRSAHLVLNVFGLVGLVIAATLPYFVATQVRSKMSPRATPTRMRVTFGALAVATVIAATGEILVRPRVVAAGLVTYAVGLLMVAAMLPIDAKARLRWAGPRVAQLLSGIAWWTAMTLALAVAAVRGSDDRTILQTLVIGGFAQILVASLAYLGPVLRGGGHQRLTAGFSVTRSWVSLIAGNAAALAAFAGNGPTLVAALVVWVTDVGVRAARLLDKPRSVARA
jgi:nitrite reductase (NO-forming)